MNKELEKKLVEKFPSFFRDIYGDPTKTCMAFGCTCGPGWYNLIYDLCEKLQDGADFKFEQIKEKFGLLRIYASGGNTESYNLISKAEDASGAVCENCGSTENITTEGGWLVTLCKECRK